MSDVKDTELEPKKEEDQTEVKEEVQTEELKSKEETTSEDIEAWKKAFGTEIAERVRKEEKEKLYPTIEKYKADAKAAEEAKSDAEKKLKDYEAENLSADEQFALKLKDLEEANNRLQSQLNETVEIASDKINSLEVELAKKDILSMYGDEIIPALVSGTTLQELQESAEKAHNEYVAIRDREIAKVKEASSKTKEKIGTGIAPRSDSLNAGVNVEDIRKINDPEEWEKVKAKLLEDAFKQQQQ